MLECEANPVAKPCNLGVISDITVRRRLPRPDKGVVLPIQSFDLSIQFVEVLICRVQPLGILCFELPSEYTAQAGRALPKRDRFGTVRVADLLFEECDALAGHPLVSSCQVIGARRGKHRL